ncbi:cytochrome b involved in lipid metabolism [Rhodoblastus acidophilus]|uniref:cytochrome b5-like heme/steroid binding domain-containing protein n=1 Tax=Rhodoblastus acidophilus TaxID=1074 RepID=UPI0029CAC07A|nr:cytochrome b5-like heme/steroid binding domain-containing protein [Rhodoblastus acidophilus]MCW2284013.1 cytochrome b involved in lipid metabolism [Rhodoblastus acidophilus]MCW2332709.1 cytochrome b involved in lipid metabolism [Rhodoblastus acidophilus]
MRKFYIASTAAFWILVGGLWLIGFSQPRTMAEDIKVKKSYTLADVAAHASPRDCWMAIGGKVYDVTTYLPDHPSRPEVIEVWCGKEATTAYETKMKGRRHSGTADQMLQGYFIGEVEN